MSQPESKLSRRIMEKLRANGYFVFKVHGSEFMMSGLPDLIVCAEGKFIGLETKLPSTSNNVSPRQSLVHSQIQHAGGHASVVCSPDEAVRRVEEVLSA